MTTWFPGLHRCRVLAWTVTVVTMGLVASTPTSSAAPLTITIPDTAGYPGQRLYLPVMISTDVDSIVGFRITYNVDRPNMVIFPTESTIDTLVICANPPSCTVTDTTYETVSAVPFRVTGDLCEPWDHIRAAITVSETNVRLTGLADLTGQPDVYIPAFVVGEPMMHVAVDIACHPDPIGGGEAVILGQPVASSFSGYYGNTISPFVIGSATITVLPLQPGDLNYSGFADSADLQTMIQCLFFNTCPNCDAVNLDLNCDGENNSVDLNILIRYLFFNASAPVCP